MTRATSLRTYQRRYVDLFLFASSGCPAVCSSSTR